MEICKADVQDAEFEYMRVVFLRWPIKEIGKTLPKLGPQVVQ